MKPERYERYSDIPDGNLGVRLSMVRLAALIRQGARTPLVRGHALALAGNAPHDLGLVERLTTWVRGHLRFTPDPPGMDRITAPEVLLDAIERQGHALGDCGAYVSLLGGLLAALAVPVELVVTSTDADQVYRHVALVAYGTEGERVPVDVSGEYAVGWEELHWTAKEVIPI